METFKDPVCGMMVREGEGFVVVHEGREYHLCSELCQTAFRAEPAHYVVRSIAETRAGADLMRQIAYFSMEVAVDSKMPTYSGGLGVLAGDTLKSCADLKIPVVGVSLIYRNGYFEQHLDKEGNQQEAPAVWDPAQFACPLPARVTVTIEGRPVLVGAWQYDIVGVTGCHVPLVLLDVNLEGVTGWSIGPRQAPTPPPEEANRRDAEDLYRKLRTEIAPAFYTRREHWMEIMRQTIAFNASFFNTHRMVQQYATNAYL